MKKTISKSEFVREFDEYNRSNNFSIRGREAMYDYITEIEEGSETEIEMDVIAICCEYSEDTLDEINSDYDREYETLEEAAEDLSNETSVIGIIDDKTIVYLRF